MAETARLKADEKAERDKIVAAIKAANYSPALAADAIGYSRATMSRRVKAYGLDGWVEEHNQRVQRRRLNRELPPAPHEASRQAQDQKRNRVAGLCGCGRQPDPLPSGAPGRMCKKCRASAREQKRNKAP